MGGTNVGRLVMLGLDAMGEGCISGREANSGGTI